MKAAAAIAALVLSVVCAHAAHAADVPVDRLTSREPGVPNAYLVDAGSEVVIVDSMGLPAEGRAIAQRAAADGKAVAAILVTHPHPGQVGGLAALENLTQAPVYGSSDTSVELAADTRGLLELSPSTGVGAASIGMVVADGDRFMLGDLTFEASVFGASESAGATVYAVVDRGAVFVGDLLTPGMTPFLLEKRTEAWLEQLDTLAGDFPPGTIAYPGHGAPGPIGPMIEAQRTYLTRIREMVGEAVAQGPLDKAERDDLAERMQAEFPDHPPTSNLVRLGARNVVAVARELAGDRPAPPLATLGD